MADDKSKKDMRRDNAVGDDSEARHFAERNGISIGRRAILFRQFGSDRRSLDREAERLKSQKFDTEIATQPGQ